MRVSTQYVALISTIAENNLALQSDLYQLRSETKDAFDEAKSLQARWKELEKEQREVYQVCPSFCDVCGINSCATFCSDLHRSSYGCV